MAKKHVLFLRWALIRSDAVVLFSGKERVTSLPGPSLIPHPGPPCGHRALPTNPCASQAATKQVMLYWLQQLQMKRWEFHSSPPAPAAAPDAAPAGSGPALHLELGTNGLASCPHTQGSC